MCYDEAGSRLVELASKGCRHHGATCADSGSANGGESMTEDDALTFKQESTWQLLLQFVPPDGPDSRRESVQRIMAAVGELGLLPAVENRIKQAVMEALQTKGQQGKRDDHDPGSSVRVWLSDLPMADTWRSGSATRTGRPRTSGGWGFFVLERQAGDAQVTQVGSRRVVELCLYQESALEQ